MSNHQWISEMAYCPECRYEYEAGVTHCPDCGRKLVDSPPEDNPPEKDIKWAKLCTLQGRLYGEMLKEVLEKEGIPCLIQGSPLQSFHTHGTELNMVVIMVPEEMLEVAADFKNELFGDA